VDAQGNVYQLASVGMQRYVFLFDSDGDLKAKVNLDPGFEWLPGFVAPFASGALLVSGVRVHLDPGEQTTKPFTGIFSAHGTLRREVTLPDDDRLHKMAESGTIVSPGLPAQSTTAPSVLDQRKLRLTETSI
jgi:hypothetical protein